MAVEVGSRVLDWLLGFCVVTHKEERLAGGFEDWDAL